MSVRSFSALIIGTLAALVCLLTAFLLPLPVWAVFVGWAAFFTTSGGAAGLGRSAVMIVAGVAAAGLALAGIVALGGSAWAVALTVGLGAAVLVALGRWDALSATPVGFLAFATTFGVAGTATAGILDPIGAWQILAIPTFALTAGALVGLAGTQAVAYLSEVGSPRARVR